MPSSFTKQQLEMLNHRKESHTSPLSVIAHVDLDGFYAQCEQVRRGLSKEVPVACRQWNSLIAVNYGAKAHGISRHDNVEEARKKCPEIVLAHVATFRKGETTWAYHDNPTAAEHKVSLDAFRRESRKIFGVVKSHASVVEKASIDEAFIDLGSTVYKRALNLFPQLETATDALPDCPSLEDIKKLDLEWKGVLIGSEDIQDWDDIFILLGSVEVARIRADILDQLKYTCSAGVGRNKILAKLGSGTNKPNNQTIVKNSNVDEFLDNSEIKDLWGFGGKLGHEIYKELDVPGTKSIPYLRGFTQKEMEAKLADSLLAFKLYKIIRGNFAAPVSTRISIKSMNSVKQFPKPQKTIEDCRAWLRVFSADIAARLLELEEEYETTVRPKVLSIHFNLPYKKPRSRQVPFSAPPRRNFEQLYSDISTAAYELFQAIFSEGVILPAAMLTLTVTGIEFQSNMNKTIESFFFGHQAQSNLTTKKKDFGQTNSEQEASIDHSPSDDQNNDSGLFLSDEEEESGAPKDDSVTIPCSKCHKRITLDDLDEHKDWHYARELQDEWIRKEQPSANSAKRTKEQASSKPSKKPANNKAKPKRKTGKDQSIMSFFGKGK